MTDTRVDLGNIPLPYLIAMAYRIKPEQVVGPDWMSSIHFDILANLPAGATKEHIPEMLQALLADRLGLKAHLRTTELPVYALLVGSKGAKLKESLPDEASDPPAAKQGGQDWGVKATGTGEDRSISGRGTGNFGKFKLTVAHDTLHLEFASMTMQNLADFLSQNKDRLVVDETGLKGSYQVTLDIAASDTAGARTASLANQGDGNQLSMASEPSGNSYFTSVEKLGLKLERRRAPTEQLVIDHVQRVPTAN
jgi:uncharacterized protein (TIGR03435 family)